MSHDAITLVTLKFTVPVSMGPGSRNSTRMNPYHRLDLGLNFTKQNSKFNFFRTISFGIYNLYNRKNPFFVYLSQGRGAANGETVANQISLFPIIPSITYNIKFWLWKNYYLFF